VDNPVDVGMVESRFRVLSDPERANAEAWLEDVWSMAQSRRPTLEDDIDADEVSLTEVQRVLANAVVRELQNPDGKLEERGDDYGFRRDSTTSSGELYLSDAEMGALTPAAADGGRSRGSVRLVAHGES
jgi:hypothetical protein